jgi:hypothetical protein
MFKPFKKIVIGHTRVLGHYWNIDLIRLSLIPYYLVYFILFYFFSPPPPQKKK